MICTHSCGHTDKHIPHTANALQHTLQQTLQHTLQYFTLLYRHGDRCYFLVLSSQHSAFICTLCCKLQQNVVIILGLRLQHTITHTATHPATDRRVVLGAEIGGSNIGVSQCFPLCCGVLRMLQCD